MSEQCLKSALVEHVCVEYRGLGKSNVLEQWAVKE